MILRLESAGRRHPTDAGANWLLRDITFMLEAGERVAVLGRSGAGKTLLLRLLCALDSPDVGTLYWNARPLQKSQVPEFRRRVIYVHQRPRFVDGSVRHNLLIPFRFAVNRSMTFDLNKTEDLFKKLELGPTMLDQDVANLSGGEQQAIALMRAMQLQPQVLLLDEPTASTDPETTRMLETLVLDWLEASHERSAVWITHSEEQAARIATRTVRMQKGRLESSK